MKKLILGCFLITSLFMKADDTIKLPEDNENKLWQTTEHSRYSSGISIFKIIRRATLKDYNIIKLDIIDVAQKNNINFIPKYNDTENMFVIGDVSYHNKPAVGYLKYDHEIESAVMTIYISDIHNKFELYKKIQENVTISDAQIEKIAVENKKNPDLKMIDSKTSSGIPYKSITISGDKDEFFSHGYIIIKELKKQGYDIGFLAEDSKRALICGLLFSEGIKNFHIWYDETKGESICYIFDGVTAEEQIEDKDVLIKYIDDKFSQS